VRGIFRSTGCKPRVKIGARIRNLSTQAQVYRATTPATRFGQRSDRETDVAGGLGWRHDGGGHLSYLVGHKNPRLYVGRWTAPRFRRNRQEIYEVIAAMISYVRRFDFGRRPAFAHAVASVW